LELSGPKGAQGLSEVQTEVIDVDDDSSLSEGDSDSVHVTGWEIVLAETRSEPVPDSSNPQPEPNPVYEERLDDFLNDFLEKVVDIDLGEGSETPIETFQTMPVQTP